MAMRAAFVPSRPSRRPRRGCAAFLAAAALAVGSGCAPSAHVPPELIGLWKTRSERHAESFLEIRSTTVMLGVSGMELEVLEIDRLEHERDAVGNDVYRFHYTATEGYSDVLVVTKLRNSRRIRVASGEGTWFPAKRR
jgi:hypothetical protein